MRIIIAPAKKMNEDTDSLACRGLPAFFSRTQEILGVLKGMSRDELKELWKCSDRIADLNVERIAHMDIGRRLTPAILAYEGIQYQYMAPGVFSETEFEYVQTHLRILSGFYGILRPFDGVVPYRLEMQAKLSVNGSGDLYGFWGGDIAEALFAETDCVLNLASKEYSLCVSKYLSGNARFITCVFGEGSGGRIVEKGTMCKMARGEMVRYMAENGIEDVDKIKGFDRLNYAYSPEHSDENTYTFLRSKTQRCY